MNGTPSHPEASRASVAEWSALPAIESWHAHVYYDADTAHFAAHLCEAARDALPVEMGRLHRKPVGPHPMWSCLLAFDNEHLAQVVSWLTMRRNGLTVFVHPNTGNDLDDHRDRAIWLGASQILKLSIFKAAREG